MNNSGKGVWAESRDLSPCIHITAHILMVLTVQILNHAPMHLYKFSLHNSSYTSTHVVLLTDVLDMFTIKTHVIMGKRLNQAAWLH